MHWAVDVWNYLRFHLLALSPSMLPLIYTILALLYLAKDWTAHKKSYRRMTVAILIVLSGALGILDSIQKGKETAGLQAAVTTANQNQVDNTCDLPQFIVPPLEFVFPLNICHRV